MSKICYTCKIEKEISEFPRNKSRKDGLSEKCNLCNRILAKQWRIQNHEKAKANVREWGKQNQTKIRNNKLLKEYGINLAQYKQMLSEQNNTCAICNQHETSKNNYGTGIRPLSVDHCHLTGKVRGLLCSKCNTALGLLNDSINNAYKLISYLERFKSEDTANG